MRSRKYHTRKLSPSFGLMFTGTTDPLHLPPTLPYKKSKRPPLVLILLEASNQTFGSSAVSTRMRRQLRCFEVGSSMNGIAVKCQESQYCSALGGAHDYHDSGWWAK